MLDAFIIEQLRRRDKVADERPTLQLPLPEPKEREQDSRPSNEEEDGQRGVVIIDFGS